MIIVITIIFLVRRYKRRTTEGEAIDASATFPLRDPVEGVDYDDEGGFRFGLIPAGRNDEYLLAEIQMCLVACRSTVHLCKTELC